MKNTCKTRQIIWVGSRVDPPAKQDARSPLLPTQAKPGSAQAPHGHLPIIPHYTKKTKIKGKKLLQELTDHLPSFGQSRVPWSLERLPGAHSRMVYVRNHGSMRLVAPEVMCTPSGFPCMNCDGGRQFLNV